MKENVNGTKIDETTVEGNAEETPELKVCKKRINENKVEEE